MLLGEAHSKCEHIAQVLLTPETGAQLHQVYLVKGAAATTAIEGNTLSESQVKSLLEGKLELPPSQQYLADEVTDIIEACNWILNEITAGRTPVLSPELIKDFNRRVLKSLTLAAEVVPGEIRGHEVGVMRYRGAPPRDCAYLLDRTCEWLNSVDSEGSEGDLAFPIIKAVLAHLYLAWIHPFGDGNGRTARLVEYLILVTSGVPSPAAHLLSNHYNQTRAEYYRQLDQASKAGGNPIPFLRYAIQGFVDGLKAQLALIRDQQVRIFWRDYLYRHFAHGGQAHIRRRNLILDISDHDHPIANAEVSEVSPRVAAAYARKSPRTLSRDLKILHEMGLLEMTESGWRPRREQILAFLPVRSSRPLSDRRRRIENRERTRSGVRGIDVRTSPGRRPAPGRRRADVQGQTGRPGARKLAGKTFFTKAIRYLNRH